MGTSSKAEDETASGERSIRLRGSSLERVREEISVTMVSHQRRSCAVNEGREHMSQEYTQREGGGDNLCFRPKVLEKYRASLRCPAGGGTRGWEQ